MSRYGLVWVYCLLFVLYWVASCYWALITVKDAAEMRAVYNDRLGISEEELVRGRSVDVITMMIRNPPLT